MIINRFNGFYMISITIINGFYMISITIINGFYMIINDYYDY
jgi:hypothetical protein